MLCVFNATDFHWPKEFSRITVIESTDQGRTWGRPRTVHETNPGRGDEERWVTPRLSLLRDGRLVIICDQNDHTHMHERQSPGIYAWWSNDGGESWDGPIPTGVPGIEPDRVRELADGTLLIGTQFTRAATQKLAEAVVRSTDGGQTWGELSIIASDAVHNYCEGAIITLRSGRLACIMRENNHNNYPSYLSFSDDQGHTWTKPVEAPFSGDRPFAGQLADGRTLVTYRNLKCYRERISLRGSRLQNGTDNVARYMLLPPESFTSEVRFDCDIQVEGPDDVPAATVQIARIGLQLSIAPNRLSAGGYERRNHPSIPSQCGYAVKAAGEHPKQRRFAGDPGRRGGPVADAGAARDALGPFFLWQRSGPRGDGKMVPGRLHGEQPDGTCPQLAVGCRERAVSESI